MMIKYIQDERTPENKKTVQPDRLYRHCADEKRLFSDLLVIPGHLIPIDDVEERLHVLAPEVFVLEVVGMFPDIDT